MTEEALLQKVHDEGMQHLGYITDNKANTVSIQKINDKGQATFTQNKSDNPETQSLGLLLSQFSGLKIVARSAEAVAFWKRKMEERLKRNNDKTNPPIETPITETQSATQTLVNTILTATPLTGEEKNHISAGDFFFVTSDNQSIIVKIIETDDDLHWQTKDKRTGKLPGITKHTLRRIPDVQTANKIQKEISGQ